MKIEWLHKSGSPRLILIFAGWSTDSHFYSHISHEGWDVAVVSGYSDLSFQANILDNYSTVSVFAWSMGVYVASHVLTNDQVSLAIAINGTEFPAHDQLGIPVAIFEGTASTLTDRNLTKFRRRMTGKQYESIKESLDSCCSDINLLRSELDFILDKGRFSGYKTGSLRWHRVYASTEDLIFPYQAQINAWQDNPFHPEIITLNSPHYVDLYPIIKGVLPSEQKIGGRFKKAITTYDTQASAQRKIAECLTNLCPECSLDNIVEIGPGTGLFTKMIAKKCRPKHMTFVDLYELDHFNVAPIEDYIIADAENWIEREANNNPKSMDAIVSASAIQWFSNPRRFFKNASKLIKPGGIFLCSTFLPGNLSELKEIAPFGLIYHTREEIEDLLKDCFKEFVLSEKTFPITFTSPRETLLHLRHTGVGGSTHSSLPIGELLSITPSTLTYRPLFILAKA